MWQLQLNLFHQLLHFFRLFELEDCIWQLTDRANSIVGQPGVLLGPSQRSVLLAGSVLYEPVDELGEGGLGQQILHRHSLRWQNLIAIDPKAKDVWLFDLSALFLR